jgi:hypothetical protein
MKGGGDSYSVESLRSSFRNVVFSRFLEYQTMDKAEIPSNSECYTTSSGPFTEYAVLDFLY